MTAVELLDHSTARGGRAGAAARAAPAPEQRPRRHGTAQVLKHCTLW